MKGETMTEQALVPLSLQETLSLGEVLSRSGYFKDTKDASQAVVKVLAGREMGFGPIASMQGINIIQGQPNIGANLLGAAIKRTRKYNYRILELTDKRCELAFFEDGQEVGRSAFTMEDANRAGLTGKSNWKQFPRNMLFARAMSNGARWYCPDVFGGVTPYTPEELGAEVDGETGEVIDVTPTPVEVTPPESPPTPPQAEQKSGGNGHGGNRVQELLTGVNAQTSGYYNHPKHILSAIRIETGDESWRWPEQNDDAAWKEAYDLAVAHAKKASA